MTVIPPGLKQLIIPNKSKKKVKGKTAQNKDHPAVAQDDYATDMRTIETWGQNIQNQIDNIAPPPSGGYASLTGPGTTNPTGTLTQGGNFIVSGNFTNSGGGNLNWNGGTASISTSGNQAYGATGTMAISGSSVTINAVTGSLFLQRAGVTKIQITSFGTSIGDTTVQVGSTTGGTTITSTGSLVINRSDQGCWLWETVTNTAVVAGAIPASSSLPQTDVGSIFLAGTGGVNNQGIELFTASIPSLLPTPTVFTHAWAICNNGHIYFFSSGTWNLVA